MLYGVAPGDVWTIVMSAMLLLATAALAGYLPARRAARGPWSPCARSDPRSAHGRKIRAQRNRCAPGIFALSHLPESRIVETGGKMKHLVSTLFVIVLGASCLLAHSEPAQIAGNWELSMESPHGAVKGPLKVEQDGAKLTAVCEIEGHGTFRFTGTVEGKKVFLEFPGGEETIKLTGTIEGGKMTGTTSMNGGAWTATRQ